MTKATVLSTSHATTDDDTTFTSDIQHDVVTVPIDPNMGLYLQGTSGNDAIWGTSGDDGIYGLAGDDFLHGGAGNDTIDGGDGNDILDGGLGADHLIGGAGIDTASYANATSAVWADLSYGGLSGEAQGDTYSGIENLTGSSHDDTLFGDAGNNVIDGGAGADWIVAGAGNDTVLGGAGNDTLSGGDGNDTLLGGAGDDILKGDNGNDTLDGGAGNNSLIGGAGSDIFVLTKGSGAVTTVSDFEFNIDKVDLHGFTAADLGNDGELAHGYFSVDSHGDQWLNWPGSNFDASDSLFYRDDTHQLIQVDHSQSNLYNSVAHGTVIATFANDAHIHTFDLLFT
ncbi:hypothetical protein IC762_31460 [Bradyrhizobium genosp. L]|uniref:calcium-binding protein n=1 Tax=Bradyrhizobium genosp. L TaxID=83637 RepID=UPI0018A2CC91|nr:calcium-binding protein [Bradyrhizobium genosp. L]QPF84098.1 hypothetical protein IC762_31460 [Bradyrhizobium genosp. L]